MTPHLPKLLEWLQDYNWPVARELQPLLVKAPLEIVPHIRNILKGDDDVWKYWVLSCLVKNLDSPIKNMLSGDVERIINHPTKGEIAEGVHIAAKEVMF